MELSIRVDDAMARRMLRKAAGRAMDLRPVWGDLNANVVQPAMLKRFDTAGAHLGDPWRPLAASTRKARVRRGGNKGGLNRPLWDTNQLRRAWVKPSGESVIVMEKMKFERGVAVPHAQYHQPDPQGREQITEQFTEHVGKEAAERIARYVVD